MSKSNKKVTWKAIVAVVLVMASLFAMSSLVNAGIVELILGEEYAEVMASGSEESSSSSEESNPCAKAHSWLNRGAYGTQTCPNGTDHGYLREHVCLRCNAKKYVCSTCGYSPSN